MKIICLIFIFSGFLSGFCLGQQTDTMIFSQPEINPTFQYDTCTSIRSSVKKYFMDKYKIPTILIDNGYTGSIYVEFVVERDSSISNIKLIRGIDEPLDKSVIETIKAMPKWIPGINKGKAVRTRFVLPVSIRWLYGKID
jgi:hypothetical protein